MQVAAYVWMYPEWTLSSTFTVGRPNPFGMRRNRLTYISRGRLRHCLSTWREMGGRERDAEGERQVSNFPLRASYLIGRIIS
jgi:hypothetical protein